MTSLPASALSQAAVTLPAAGAFPVLAEVVPSALSATVYLHQVPSQGSQVLCWSYVTSGLEVHGQREIVFTVRVGAGQAPNVLPMAPLRLAATLLQLASQGRRVEEGGVTELGGAGFLGGRGLVYVAAPPLDGVQSPPRALLALRLCAEELEVLRAFGATRLLASLGRAFSHYPFPPWSEEGRPAVVTPASFQDSLLGSVPCLPVVAWATQQNNALPLGLLESEAPRFAQAFGQLPPEAGFALLTRIDPDADGCLVWQAGQRHPAAITPPGSQGARTCGAFVLVAPQQQSDEARLHEDGFALLLTDRTAAQLRHALASAQPFTLRGAPGKLGLSFSWAPMRYHNPVDGSVLETSGGFRTHSPQQPAPATGPVRTKKLALLTSEQELASASIPTRSRSSAAPSPPRPRPASPAAQAAAAGSCSSTSRSRPAPPSPAG
jgi:hypothetical protein